MRDFGSFVNLSLNQNHHCVLLIRNRRWIRLEIVISGIVTTLSHNLETQFNKDPRHDDPQLYLACFPHDNGEVNEDYEEDQDPDQISREEWKIRKQLRCSLFHQWCVKNKRLSKR